MTPDEMIERMGEDFPEGSINVDAIDEMQERILRAARSRKLLKYSDVVSGIAITHPTFWPNEHLVDTHNWSGLDRRMIGGVLARLSIDSLRENGFFIGCLVVDKQEAKPSDILFEWLCNIGVISDNSETAILSFWADNVRRIHQYYAG